MVALVNMLCYLNSLTAHNKTSESRHFPRCVSHHVPDKQASPIPLPRARGHLTCCTPGEALFPQPVRATPLCPHGNLRVPLVRLARNSHNRKILHIIAEGMSCFFFRLGSSLLRNESFNRAKT